MSRVVSPRTWINNKTEDKVVLITEDELGFRVGEKWIGPGSHVDLYYREGIDTMALKIQYLVQPVDRPDLRGPKILMPFDVFRYADIDVVYELGDGTVSGRYEDGASVGFVFKNATLVRRIGLVRWVGGLCDSVAKYGTCYHAPPAAPVQALGPVQVLPPVEAPVQVLAPMVAPPSVQVLVPGEAPAHEAPAPATDDHNYDIKVVIDSPPAQAPSPPPAANIGDVPAAEAPPAGIQVAIY